MRADDEALPTTVWPLTVNAVADAFPKVDCPVTLNVPLEVKEEVAVRVPIVALPPVKEERVAVTAFKRVAKKLEEVALVLVKLVTTPVVEKRFVAVTPVAEALFKYA